MTDPSTPPALATALAYYHAWTSQDLDQAMSYIADGIICDAPGARISGAQQYRDFSRPVHGPAHRCGDRGRLRRRHHRRAVLLAAYRQRQRCTHRRVLHRR
jgi:hypothetical protein